MMDRFEITGGSPLNGAVDCAGSKNGALPLMAASLLAEGVTVLRNAPNLQDVNMMAMVLRVIGADVHLSGSEMTIDCTHCNFWEAPYELVRKMRASFYVLGPLAARFKKAKVSLPGGCNLGPRPVDLHLKALAKLGANIELDSGYVYVDAGNLQGARIDLEIPSVGATGNILMAAVAAEGKTTIHNAACEPEIQQLVHFLNKMGANIKGAGTQALEITGPSKLKPVAWEVDPDRIEAATLLLAGAITKGTVTVDKCRADHLGLFIEKLREAGAEITVTDDSIKLDASQGRLRGVDIKTNVYPGFPTDIQPMWTALMTICEGDSIITDTIYPERFNHIPELTRLGARISKDLNTAHVKGVEKLKGASVMCSDIRAAAAVTLGALAAEGNSHALRIYHLDRGYQKFEEKIAKLGGNIRRVRE